MEVCSFYCISAHFNCTFIELQDCFLDNICGTLRLLQTEQTDVCADCSARLLSIVVGSVPLCSISIDPDACWCEAPFIRMPAG